MKTIEISFPDPSRIIRAALDEDVGHGDVTTTCTVAAGTISHAYLLAKEPMRLAGLPAFCEVFNILGMGDDAEWKLNAKDGDDVDAGTRILEVRGDARILLTGERTALNLLQRLSGIATMAARWTKQLENTKCKLVDTRKTTPCLRSLEKYAVRMGGAFNHRFGLYDGLMIKENHARAAGGITNAVRAARENCPHTLKIEVEVADLGELREALEAGADILLLDNMNIENIRQSVSLNSGAALLEVSGGITEEKLREIAEAGVDLISAGALTHSARAVDLSFLFDQNS